MKINRDNYEAYFLDYHEGTLTPEEMAEVLVFVGQNPDLKEQFEEFENIQLPADESISYAGKDLLKMNSGTYTGPITLRNIDEYLVAEAEGLLSAEMLAQLDEFVLQYPQFEKDRRIYQHTLLVADNQIVFSKKDSLKHSVVPTGRINESNYEDYLVRELEGTLTPEEAVDLNGFVKENPQVEVDRKLFGMTRLQPDTSIVYPAKSSLKHTVVPLRRIVYYAMSAAASVIILLGLYLTLNLNKTSNQVALSKIGTDQSILIPDLSESAYHQAVDSEPATIEVNSIKTAGDNKNKPVGPASNNLKNQRTLMDRSEMPRMGMLAQNEVTSRHQVAPEFLFIRQSQLYGSRYIDLYNSVKLSEQIQYASLNTPDRDPLNTLWRGLTGKVEEQIVDNQRTAAKPTPGFSIWTVAEVGVRAYNTISHDDLELLLQKDETGKVVSYALVGDKVNFERGVK